MISANVIDMASPELRAMRDRVANPQPGLRVAGRAVCNLLKSFYRAKDNLDANKSGGMRTHFWRQIGQGVNQPVDRAADTVSISISHPAIQQKIFGGRIRAKRAGALTIPIHSASYGRTVSVFERVTGIELWRRARGARTFLFGKTPGGAIRAFYILKKSVNQQKDPTALPSENDIMQTAMTYFERWVNRKGS